MAGRSVARRRIEELAGVLLGIVDQLSHGMKRCLGRYGQWQLAARNDRDRLKVAVRRHFRREIEPERERASGPIVDHDLLMEFIRQRGGQHACQRIHRSAGGLRRDWIGLILSGRAGGNAERRQHERNKKY